MQHLEHELDDLKQRLLTMARKAADAVGRAIKSLVDRDDDLARPVEADDTQLDQLEMELDDRTVQLLSKAPLASDLRLLMVSLKICQNLEHLPRPARLHGSLLPDPAPGRAATIRGRVGQPNQHGHKP